MRYRLALLTVIALFRPALAVDQNLLDAVLGAHVSGGLVDYAGLASDARLGQYVAQLAPTDPTQLGGPKAELAFYVNAYNALVLKGIVDHWPVASVVKLSGFFDKASYQVAGQTLTLDQLENDKARRYGDPRVHAALVCGALSCPLLRSEAYRADKLDAQLDDQCRQWVNDPTRNRLDRGANKLLVSKIFDWYRDDFERAGGPAGFIRKYLTDEEAQRWVGAGGYAVGYLDFNWAVNKQ